MTGAIFAVMSAIIATVVGQTLVMTMTTNSRPLANTIIELQSQKMQANVTFVRSFNIVLKLHPNVYFCSSSSSL